MIKWLTTVFLFLLYLTVVCISSPTQLFAQNSSDSEIEEAENRFTLDLEIRPRFEYRNGFKAPMPVDASPAAFTEQRSRAYLGYQTNELEMRITIQDVRIWGDHNQIYKSDPSLTNLYEAWALYRLDNNWAVKFGRQALDYDNARFLGNLDWAQQGRSHDAFLAQYRDGNFKADAGLTFNQADIFEPTKLTESFYPLAGNNKSMQFLWLSTERENGRISFLIHNDGRQQQDEDNTVWRQTIGVNGSRFLDELTLSGEFYHQFGEDMANRDIRAFMLNLEAAYLLQDKTLTLGLDWLSGTELDSENNNSFDPLYGTNHKFYGFMDYFHVGNPHAQPGNDLNVGLINPYQKIRSQLGDNLNFYIQIHQFIAPVDIFNEQGNSMSRYLGTELDLMLSWNPVTSTSFIIGYSHMFASDSLKRIKGDGDLSSNNSWAWAMFRVNPRVLSI